MIKKTIIGNWKMNPLNIDEATVLFKSIVEGAGKFKKINTVICPPTPFLERLFLLSKKKITIGAEDCFFGESGPYTGEVSAEMLKSVGVKYVIVGHSERRALGDDDEMISKKVKSAVDAGLRVVLCVGETKRDESGEYLNFVKNQIVSGLSKIKRSSLRSLFIAYEPVWAIGKSAVRASNPQDVLEMSIFIKKILTEIFGREDGIKVPIIYGGSVDINNSHDFLQGGKVDGLLVGRESLNPQNFIKILEIANNV